MANKERTEATATVLSVAAENVARGRYSGITLANKYRLERVLGAGGMGEVYAGTHLSLRIPIAIKLMHPELAANPEYLTRFFREARAIATVNHPNIVRVLDSGTDGDIHFIIMEFLHGQSVDDWLTNLPSCPSMVDVEHICRGITLALEAAHQSGVLHRDLKPDNVFLVNNPNGRPFIKVVDFGLAHLKDDKDTKITHTRSVMGTPSYMSPEQCHSLAGLGPAADLYSLGCVLTCLLQKEPPFEGTTPMEVVIKHMFSPPPALKRPLDAEPIPPALERLRLSLLAKTPDGRPPSAKDVLLQLERIFHGGERGEQGEFLEDIGRKADLGADRLERARELGTLRESIPVEAGTARKKAALIRLHPSNEGVSDIAIAGMASQRIELVSLTVEQARAQAAQIPVVLLDAAHDTSAAVAFAQSWSLLAQAPPLLVCIAQLGTEQMNALVAAGASDVLAYPVTVDKLARKVERLLRRKR